MRVDQVIPSLASRDAIGVHTINLRDGLRAAGVDSDIYYGSFTPDVEHEGRPVTELGRGGRGDRWLLYQSSIGSPVYDLFAARDEPKLVNYHNITPASLLRDWEPNVGYEVALGRTQLGRLAQQSRFAVADSAFNESELRALGYVDTAVVPLLIDMHRKSDAPDPALLARMAERKGRGGADLLFVGKISPHKAPHDLVKMLSVLRTVYDPAARLHLVGSPLGETYEPALRAFIHDVGLDDAVFFPGSISGAELEAYFQSADVFVCASDHEGFCVPLAEAMGHGTPIVAYGVTAVPETVAGAGLVLDDKEPVHFAAAVARVLNDGALRDHLSAAGRARAEEFNLPDSQQRFVSLIQHAIERSS
ncbi:MAG TPA: glycosyltransferase [Acidimicrobiales bacterium]|nr:glycosyltransferase [Acidimicrobiales bacterium]